MITQFLTRVFTSRPVKLLIFVAVLLLVASQLVPQAVDTRPYVEAIGKEVHELTGATLLVKGGAKLELLPRPALLLRTVEISQPDVANSPTLETALAELQFDIPSLLSGSPAIEKAILTKASLIAERGNDGQPQWGYLGTSFLKNLSALKTARPLMISVLSGQATLADAKSGSSDTIEDIRFSGVLGSESAFSGVFTYRGEHVTFSTQRTGTIGATPLSVQLSVTEGPTLTFKGNMDFTASYPVIAGKLDVTSADISRYIESAPPATSAADKNATPAVDDRGLVPFSLSGDFLQKEGGIQLSNISLDTLNSKATGHVEWSTAGKGAYTASMNFSSLDLTSLRKVLATYTASVTQGEDDGQPKTLTPKELNVAFDITADKVLHDAQQWGKASLNGTVADGSLTVNQLTLSMPGDSRLTLFGLLSVSDTQGLRFEGNTEATGSSLRDMLTIFDESASNLPALGFGDFQLKSNIFVSKELLRLSEATAKLSELAFKGGLVTYFDKRPRIESDIILSDINFDYFRDSWRKDTNAEQGQDFLRFDRSMNFDWLKKLDASIDFRVQVQGFTFLERKGTGAAFRIFAQTGEFGVYNAKFVYPTDTTEGSLKLDVLKDVPNINLVLNTSTLNTNYFAHTPLPPEPVVQPASAVAPEAAAVKPAELPDMVMPDATPEDDLRQKIAEEAKQLDLESGGAPVSGPAGTDLATEQPAVAPSNVVISDPEKPESQPQSPTPSAPSAPAITAGPVTEGEAAPATDAPDGAPQPSMDTDADEASPVELTPLTPQAIDPSQLDENSTLTRTPQSLVIRDAEAQQAPVVAEAAAAPATAADTAPVSPDANSRWSQDLIDLGILEGISGNFDISVGKLQHKDRLFENFKMMAKLERNLLTFQALTFQYWGGSFSLNGTLFGGKVPGLSLGFIIASADIDQMLGGLLGMHGLGGRASISGTLDTSGVNMLSWVSQANAKLLVAGRGVTIRGFDMGGVVGAVSASRTAADVFNNVNLTVVGGTGQYSADGSINLTKGVMSTPGIALKTGRVTGTMTGSFRLLPWDMNVSGTFKFPELSMENTPSMTVRWAGPLDKLDFQTDTQALEAFVSKRIIGN